jgi:hypothetical protein
MKTRKYLFRIGNDTCRCLSEKPDGICEARQICARYLQRDTYDQTTPFARWLCGPNDQDHIIRIERK